MEIVVITSPFDIPDDWDLGRNPDWTPELGAQVAAETQRKMAEWYATNPCVGCGHPKAEGDHGDCFQF